MCFFLDLAFNLACGPEIDPYDYHTSFFHNNIQGEPGYKPFYFNSYTFMYSNTEPESEAGINVKEWVTYLGKNVNVADVDKVMYRLDSKTDSILVSQYLKASLPLPDSLAANTFLKSVIANKPALKYYIFAKATERLVNYYTNPWDPSPVDTAGMLKQSVLALKNAAAEKDSFLKLRYYYQAQRLLHYAAKYNEASKVYDENIGGAASVSHVKVWALALKAGELRWLGDTLHSAYLFSKIFAQYPERRIQAYINFTRLHIKPELLLPLAQSNAEKAVIDAIAGFGKQEIDANALEQVYALDPESPMVGVLLVREINKLEEGYLSPKLADGGKGPTTKYDLNVYTPYYNGFKNTERFCRQLVADGKYPDAPLGSLALAYLAWMQGHTNEGMANLKVLQNVKLKQAFNDQKQIIDLLLSAQLAEKQRTVDGNTLLPALKWLDAKARTEASSNTGKSMYDNYPRPFGCTARDFYNLVLAPIYLKNADTTMAALVYLSGDRTFDKEDYHTIGSANGVGTDFWGYYLKPAMIGQLIDWKKYKPADLFIAYLSEKLKVVGLADLYELQGTAYLREHQYAKAAECLRQVPAAKLNKFPSSDYGDENVQADPFIERINDYPKVYTYAHGKGYNKLQFALAMSQLQDQINTDPTHAASYYYKMGIGLYNTSMYGNAWYLIAYGWTADDYARPAKYPYDADYVKALNAEQYFLKALKLSQNKEFKAKCVFMAAKCSQKEYTMPAYDVLNYDELKKVYHHNIRSNTYFTLFKSDFKKTLFYKKAVGECSYLKDFIVAK